MDVSRIGSDLHYAEDRAMAESLVNSIPQEKQRDFVFSVDADQCTALHAASIFGTTDVVEYLCGLYPNDDELILKRDKSGMTALHYAENREIAEVLVQSVQLSRQEDFILAVDVKQRTALHIAAKDGKDQVVEYLCSLCPYHDVLLTKEDINGSKALHHAKNKRIAKLLVDSVAFENQEEFVLSGDVKQNTALHTAAKDGRTDVVEYLCSLHPTSEQLVLKKNNHNKTALFFATTREVARLLVNAVSPEGQRDYVHSADSTQLTALHVAAYSGRTDVVQYLCSLYSDDELILKKGLSGETALHLVANGEIAKLLVNSVRAERQMDFIISVNKTRTTPLLLASHLGRSDVVEYFCKLPQIDAELVFAQIPLHFANNATIAKILLGVGNSELLEKTFLLEVSGGYTPILMLTKLGRSRALREVLLYMEENYDANKIRSFLQKHNKHRQNILHLAALSSSLKELYTELQQYLYYADVKSLIYPDVYGNTPIHYVAAKYDTKVFADFILQLPLSGRKSIANSQNVRLVDCRTIIKRKGFHEQFYMQKILCNNTNKTLLSLFSDIFWYSKEFQNQLKHPETLYRYDETILKVLKYSLNEYSLLDPTYTTSHTLFSSAAAIQQTIISSVNETGVSKALASPVEDDCMFIAIDTDRVGEPKQQNIQNALNEMDLPGYSGKPKIAVIQMSAVDEGLDLMPPGPDYLLLSVKYSRGYTRRQTPDMKSYKSIQHLIAALSCNPNVQKIDVNSTLNKRFVREENEVLADNTKFLTDTHRLVAIAPASRVVQNPAYDEANRDAEKEITGKIVQEIATSYTSKEKTGKALIICNNLGLSDNPTDSEKVISQLRKEALAHAQKIFTNHLGFWVEVKQDLSAGEMLSSIHQFSKSEEHESLAALVVFSHGKDGMIDGHDGVSKCSTQEVVNTFNSGQVTAIPKLLFLSCCRGDISAIYNRAPHSFASSNEFPWPENEVELLYKPTEQVLPDTERDEEWRRLTFQRLDLPADCYVCFTTLPDSRSKAGRFFKYFFDYLSQLTNSGPYQPTVSIDDIINDEAEPPMEVCKEYRHRLLLLEGASPSVQRVELVDLLTDVAGVLREKFQSKQYFNLCYSVNRDSNQVFIDVLPSGS